jgi:hypothetical protein
MALLTNLIANGKRAVLVVDNCPPDLHERSTETCRRENSKVSLPTNEYGVRDDQPEGTHIVRRYQASISASFEPGMRKPSLEPPTEMLGCNAYPGSTDQTTVIGRSLFS